MAAPEAAAGSLPPRAPARTAPGLRALSAAALWLALAGCGGTVEDLVESCIDLDGPEFATVALPAAVAGQPYAARVLVELVREPFDDDFEYEFRVEGALPPGLQARQVARERRLEIAGVPNAEGTFAFTLSVHVTDPLQEDAEAPRLCWFDAELAYRIVVAPGPG